MDDFSEIVGQQAIKNQLQLLLQGFHQNGIIYPLLFTGPKGQGKTSFARALAKRLIDPTTKLQKKLVEINCASLRQATVDTFFNQIVAAHIAGGQQVTLFFDEASEISRDITMMLLTVLDPENHKSVNYSNGVNSEIFDLSKITWIFATSEPHKIFHALLDRLEHLDLAEYSHEEMSLVISKVLDHFKTGYNHDALLEVAKVTRGNARNAVQMGRKLVTKIRATGGVLDLATWNAFKTECKIYPLGLKEQEVNILNLLNNRGPCSLTRLSAITGLTADALRKGPELYLLKQGFLEIITPAGRTITAEGKQYLATCKN